MNNVRPADLTEPQWLLLRHLNKLNSPFCTEPLYTQFSRHHIDRLPFYMMFFSLAVLSYIKLGGYEKPVPGKMQDFYYTLTAKGKKTIAEYTRVNKEDDSKRPKHKTRTKGIIATHLTRTVRLKDYSLTF